MRQWVLWSSRGRCGESFFPAYVIVEEQAFAGGSFVEAASTWSKTKENVWNKKAEGWGNGLRSNFFFFRNPSPSWDFSCDISYFWFQICCTRDSFPSIFWIDLLFYFFFQISHFGPGFLFINLLWYRILSKKIFFEIYRKLIGIKKRSTLPFKG